MGWEYHNRPRDHKGRWVEKHATKPVDVHLTLLPGTFDKLRHRASIAHEEMSTYVDRALTAYWDGNTAEGHVYPPADIAADAHFFSNMAGRDKAKGARDGDIRGTQRADF